MREVGAKGNSGTQIPVAYIANMSDSENAKNEQTMGTCVDHVRGEWYFERLTALLAPDLPTLPLPCHSMFLLTHLFSRGR